MQTEAVNGILPLVFKGVELRGCTKRVLLNNAIRTELECGITHSSSSTVYRVSCTARQAQDVRVRLHV